LSRLDSTAMLVPEMAGPARLRLLDDDDADELYALIAADRERLARWMPWAAGQTLQGTREFIRETRRQHAGDGGMQTAIVVEAAIAGVVGVHGISWIDRTTSIGYWLGERFTGRGLMTEAVRAYTRHAFDAWGLHRMELRAAVGNAPSRAIAERLGFVFEGVARGAQVVGDRRYDLAVYAALAPEWPRGAGGGRATARVRRP
jgi:ribosomal-protein-serine acetyltransferase